MSGVESSDRWNERQEQDVKLIQCIRDNPLVALGKPRDILAILREGSDPREYPNWHGICRAAADEIERLRAEIAIPRDEYAKTWQCVLDRIEGMDISCWLREYAKANDPSDFKSPIAASVISRTDAKYIEAADEIERLRAEQGSLRAEIVDRACHLRMDPTWHRTSKERARCEQYAQKRGWHHLFAEINARVDEIEGKGTP